MENKEYIPEKHIPNQPKSIPTEEMKILLDLTKTHICKIYCKDGGKGTWFFCHIPKGFVIFYLH